MGLCSSTAEPAPVAKAQARSFMDSFAESNENLAGLQPSPLITGESFADLARREVNAATESFAISQQTASSSSLDSLDLGLPYTPISRQRGRHCSCQLRIGAEVLLSPGYKQVLDAEEGCLEEGAIGIVSGTEAGSTPERELYCVHSASGSTWWYARCALQLNRCLDPTGCKRQSHDLEVGRMPTPGASPMPFEADLRLACESSTKVAAVACARWNKRVNDMKRRKVVACKTLQPG